jgi:hypothetical protein
MPTTIDSIAQRFVQLALNIDRHLPGYVDAYFGPPEWQASIKQQGPRPVNELQAEAEALAAAVAQDTGPDAQRRDYVSRHITAMQTSLRLLSGERLPLAQEASLLFDVTPAWTAESEFTEIHRRLDDLLPAGGSLAERLQAHKRATEVSYAQAEQLIPLIVAHLRQLTHARFPLPADESFEVYPVSNQPWKAYNWYLGRCRSRIEINTDLPLPVMSLALTMAHEGYPGHHTELSIKETRLVQARGQAEHTVVLINSPACMVAEGIAVHALDILMTEDQQVQWYTTEILPRAGFAHLNAGRELLIARETRQLGGVWDNAAFLLHEDGASPAEVKTYFQRYALTSEPEAGKAVDFISDPLSRSYVFNYGYGEKLLAALFAARGNRDDWFTRLLSEPVTPSQIRAWTVNGA